MALSGYPAHYYSESNNVKVPATPNLKQIMNETNNQLINNFMNHLFHIQEELFKVGKKLRPLLECMFASLLMYHTTLLNKFGQTHIITSMLSYDRQKGRRVDKLATGKRAS
jgi:geranylgeranyl pyrophosphate synthase